MSNSRLEELFDQLVQINLGILDRLDQLISEVRDVNGELNWVGDHAFAKRIVDGIDAIENAVESLGS